MQSEAFAVKLLVPGLAKQQRSVLDIKEVKLLEGLTREQHPLLPCLDRRPKPLRLKARRPSHNPKQ